MRELCICLAFFILVPFASGSASEKANQDKPHMTIGILGHIDHGKTTLAAAITKVLAGKGMAQYTPFDKLDKAPEISHQGVRLGISKADFQTEKRRYTIWDCPGHADYIKNMITGAAQMDGAILVVAADDGPMPQTREHILLAKQLGVQYLVVFINKIDLIDDPTLIGLVESETRELLSKYGFPGNRVPIIRGSALKALKSDSPDSADAKAIFELTNAIDSYIQEPIPIGERPFLMSIESVVSTGREGVFVTGRVERGVIKAGDQLEIVGLKPTSSAVCDRVEMSGKVIERGQAGQTIRVFLPGMKSNQVERGQVLAKAGSISPIRKFTAEVYVLKKEEGGRHTPFFTSYRPQFHFNTATVSGLVILPEDVEMVMPGDNVSMGVDLVAPVAIEEGFRFSVGEDSRTVAHGVVTQLNAVPEHRDP